MTRQDTVAAVMVAWQPAERTWQAIDAIAPQVGALLVVDNASEEAAWQGLSESCDRWPNARLLRNRRNEGLAAAQNRGIAAALSRGFDYVLLLDDDSIAAGDMVTVLLQAARSHKDVGLVAPRLEDEAGSVAAQVYLSRHRWHWWRHRLRAGQVLDSLGFAIASGSLIPAAVLKAAGPMRADFFIDYIDVDFSLRLRKRGYRLYAHGDAVLYHRLGQMQASETADEGPFSHSAVRRYTIYRNRVRLWRLYGRDFPAWLCFEWLACGRDLCGLLCCESDRLAKLRAIWQGGRDGLRWQAGR